jgi:hypothetical protein
MNHVIEQRVRLLPALAHALEMEQRFSVTMRKRCILASVSLTLGLIEQAFGTLKGCHAEALYGNGTLNIRARTCTRQMKPHLVHIKIERFNSSRIGPAPQRRKAARPVARVTNTPAWAAGPPEKGRSTTASIPCISVHPPYQFRPRNKWCPGAWTWDSAPQSSVQTPAGC